MLYAVFFALPAQCHSADSAIRVGNDRTVDVVKAVSPSSVAAGRVCPETTSLDRCVKTKLSSSTSSITACIFSHQTAAIASFRQAHVGLERGRLCFSDPVYPDVDGLQLLPYTGGDCLTYEGEINKMAVNIAFGRYKAYCLSSSHIRAIAVPCQLSPECVTTMSILNQTRHAVLCV